MSFIYNEMQASERQKYHVGFFKTKLEFKEIEPNNNFVYSFKESSEITINKDTTILYYCGAFTYFHKGHLALITKSYLEMKAKGFKDIKVVISPSNSDYIYEKYGPKVNARNKERFERIVKFINDNCPLGISENVIIDMNPMLNMECDYNFTDLIRNFIEKYLPYDNIKTPYIICGGDRKYFKNIEKFTNKIKVICFDRFDNTSSSQFKTEMGVFNKKEILLRVHTKEEYKIFNKHMKIFYKSITPILISEEIKQVKNLIDLNTNSGYDNIKTNCRSYRDILDYDSVHRVFKHPLDFEPSVQSEKLKSKTLYIDSDVFSGATKKHIESFGSSLTVLYDFRFKQETHDIVDIDDMYKSNFKYPFYDLSERMGLEMFSVNTHKVIKDLKEELLLNYKV